MKKIICSLLIALSSISIANAAELSDAQKKDLAELNIMTGDENGSLNLDKNITRAEAARIICSAGAIEPKTSEAPFPDVSADHWAYKYICAAKDAGIVAGDENGYFNPQNNVTNEEIVKMIDCLLGYDAMADFLGGYPAGYTAVAAQFGLTKDMKLIPGGYATRNDVGIMISNALNLPMVIKKDDYTHFVADGTEGMPKITLRSKYHTK